MTKTEKIQAHSISETRFIEQMLEALKRAKVVIELERQGNDYAHQLFYIDKAIEAAEKRLNNVVES